MQEGVVEDERQADPGRTDMNERGAARLALAVQHWLDFQILCEREMLLSEGYLSQPVGEFLRAHHTGGIRAEWNIPNLRQPGRGRRRQVDYALLSRDAGRLTCAIEAKWVSSGQIDKQRIVDDLMRLECVRNPEGQHHPDRADGT